MTTSASTEYEIFLKDADVTGQAWLNKQKQALETLDCYLVRIYSGTPTLLARAKVDSISFDEAGELHSEGGEPALDFDSRGHSDRREFYAYKLWMTHGRFVARENGEANKQEFFYDGPGESSREQDWLITTFEDGKRRDVLHNEAGPAHTEDRIWDDGSNHHKEYHILGREVNEEDVFPKAVPVVVERAGFWTRAVLKLRGIRNSFN